LKQADRVLRQYLPPPTLQWQSNLFKWGSICYHSIQDKATIAACSWNSAHEYRRGQRLDLPQTEPGW
jgi:hypothetical protein